jgi:hypothetical protein
VGHDGFDVMMLRCFIVTRFSKNKLTIRIYQTDEQRPDLSTTTFSSHSSK